jgi:hypothetical protein
MHGCASGGARDQIGRMFRCRGWPFRDDLDFACRFWTDPAMSR